MATLVDAVEERIAEAQREVDNLEKSAIQVEVEANAALGGIRGQIAQLQKKIAQFVEFRDMVKNPAVPPEKKEEELPPLEAPPELLAATV